MKAKKLFLFTLLTLLVPFMAAAVSPRDTVFISDRFTTHILMPAEVESAEAPQEAPFLIALSAARPEMIALRASAPFKDTYILTIEDMTGAFRVVAVAYQKRPEILLKDFRPGAPLQKWRKDLPVIDVTSKKDMHLLLPGRVTYSERGASNVLSTEVGGADNNDIVVKAPKAFSDSTNITLCDATGTLHMYLVRYRKSLKTTSMKLDIDERQVRRDEKPAQPAFVATARDTVYVSSRYTSHILFPADIETAKLSGDADLLVDFPDAKPDLMMLRAEKPFDGTTTVTAEDVTGAYRLVAVAYADRPKTLVTDMRPGSPDSKAINDIPLIEVSDKKDVKLHLADHVTYVDYGTEGRLKGNVLGDDKSDITLRALSTFKDTVNITVFDGTGSMYAYLVRFNRKMKVSDFDLRTAPILAQNTPQIKKEEPKKVEEKKESVKKEDPKKQEKQVSDNKKATAEKKETIVAVVPVQSDDGRFVSALDSEPAPKAPVATVSMAPPTGRDTVFVSDHYTTHLIFSTEINYADLSNQRVLMAQILDASKNKLAIKARSPFESTASVSVEEADGSFRTLIVAYKNEPEALIMDMRPGAVAHPKDAMEIVEVSEKFTTHIIFATDINYADLSKPSVLTGKLVDQGKNKLALMARAPFKGMANITVEEANGMFHSYLLRYKETPDNLVVDTREDSPSTAGRHNGSASVIRGSKEKEAGVVSVSRRGLAANALKRGDAPLLSDVVEMRQSLYHIGTSAHHLMLMCENIFAYSDITYLVLSLKNDSGISFETGDATFVLESHNGMRRKIVYEKTIFPKNRFGKLTTAARSESRIAYSFDKLTMSNDQVLKIYVYENGGNRNLVLTLTAKDINGAIEPF